MEGIGAIGGMITGLAGAAVNASWQAANYYLSLDNLRWQKRQGERQFNLASAARTDAYGNKNKYDELLNEWQTTLTPTQNKLIKAGENEQLRTLTEDAPRARDIKRDQRRRGKEAAEDYVDVKAAYKYDQPQDEMDIRGQLQSLLQGASNAKRTQSATEIGRDAIRQGRGAMLGQILKAGWNDQNADWAGNLLKARTMGLQESSARQQQHEGQYLPMLKHLEGIMDLGGDVSQPRVSDTPNQLSAMQGQQTNAMLSALQKEAAAVNQANAQVGKSLDGSGIASALKGIGSQLGGLGKAGKNLARSTGGDGVNWQDSTNDYSGIDTSYMGDYSMFEGSLF